ncbi:hypothetical protein D3C81_595860 [compost metagenome]
MVKTQAHTTPNASASTASTSSRLRLVLATASISRAVVSMLARWCSSKSCTIFWYLAAAGTNVFSNTSLAASTCDSPFSLYTWSRELMYTLRCSSKPANMAFSSGRSISASIFFCSSAELADETFDSSAK